MRPPVTSGVMPREVLSTPSPRFFAPPCRRRRAICEMAIRSCLRQREYLNIVGRYERYGRRAARGSRMFAAVARLLFARFILASCLPSSIVIRQSRRLPPCHGAVIACPTVRRFLKSSSHIVLPMSRRLISQSDAARYGHERCCVMVRGSPAAVQREVVRLRRGGARAQLRQKAAVWRVVGCVGYRQRKRKWRQWWCERWC